MVEESARESLPWILLVCWFCWLFYWVITTLEAKPFAIHSSTFEYTKKQKNEVETLGKLEKQQGDKRRQKRLFGKCSDARIPWNFFSKPKQYKRWEYT